MDLINNDAKWLKNTFIHFSVFSFEHFRFLGEQFPDLATDPHDPEDITSGQGSA